MLILSPTQSNLLNVTLYENSTNLVNPYFTWKLVNKQSLVETVFYQDDSSTTPWYYNSFTVSIATPVGLTQGIINIPAGEYQYFVYQMNNPYDLNLNNAVKEVENGILVLNATYSQYLSYTQSSGTVLTYNNMDRI